MGGISINVEIDCPEGNPIRKPRCRCRNAIDAVFAATPGGSNSANGFSVEVSILEEYCTRFAPQLADGISKNRSQSIAHPRGHSRFPIRESVKSPVKLERGGVAPLRRYRRRNIECPNRKTATENSRGMRPRMAGL